MATTTINSPSSMHSPGERSTWLLVLATIVAATLLLFGLTYLALRDAPSMGEPGTLDQAEGVPARGLTPPVTPADSPARGTPSP